MQPAKALHANEIPGGNRISFKISKDRQGPHSGCIAALWKNGGTHLLDGAAGITAQNQRIGGEILPNSYALEQIGADWRTGYARHVLWCRGLSKFGDKPLVRNEFKNSKV